MSPTGLYVHVPFCARACPYCDFDFEVDHSDARVDAWLEGLERERVSRAGELDGASFDTVYLGGGTPSVLSPEQLRRLSGWLREGLGVAADRLLEFNVELNPEHVSPELLDAIAEIGVDRVSLGVQSLVPEGLRVLGRMHTSAQARESVLACVARGLRTSADLIVGWPGHAEAALIDEIDQLIDAGAEHLSIYALTIEPDTPWPKLVRRGLRVLPDEDEQAERLLAAERRLTELGLVHYEIASYARPGAEARHNGKYWRFLDVVGFGPSAASVCHGLEEGAGVVERRVNVRGLGAWLGDPTNPERERLEGERAAAEGLWLGLRRLGGLDVEGYLERFCVDRRWLEARVARQLALGNLEFSEGGALLRVSPGRWLWHDGIAVDLL